MSHLVVCGLNYHSTPLAIRERFTIPESCLSHALRALAGMPHVQEAVVLSTCNRTEVYAVVSSVQAGLQEIESFFLSAQRIADHESLRPNFKLLRDDVALHLFRVAAGLDSMVLGEGQIMSQVKAAHQAALEAATAGTVLDQLFKMALTCGKRVRSETSMSRRAVSVSSAAVELGRNILGSLKDKTTLVVGAGRMAQVCVKHLLNESGKGKIILVNRSPERVQSFLRNSLPNRERISSEFSFSDRFQLAAAADLVIVSTSAPGFVLTAQDFHTSPASSGPVVIDISVPRNVDPAIAEIAGVRLFNADDLSAIVNRNLAQREALVGEAEQIVFQALDDYHAWQRSLLVVPTIAELRQKIESIRIEQMEKNQGVRKGGQQGGSHTETAGAVELEEISRAIVNQILHHPTVQLKATRDYQILRQQAEALRTLFNLDGKRADSTSARRSDKAAPCQHTSKQRADATSDQQVPADLAGTPDPVNRGA